MGSMNDKEKEFKSVLENLDFEINTDQIWERVSPHLNTKDKDKPFLFYLLGLALAVMIGGGAVYTLMQDSNQENLLSESVSSLNSNKNIESTRNIDGSDLDNKVSSFANVASIDNTSNENLAPGLLSQTSSSSSSSSLNKIYNSSDQSNLSNATSKVNDISGNRLNVVSASLFDENKLLSEGNESAKLIPSLHNNKIVSFDVNEKLTNAVHVEKSPLTIVSEPAVNNVESILFLENTKPYFLVADQRENEYELNSNFVFIDVVQDQKNNWKPYYMLSLGANKSISQTEINVASTDFDTKQFERESGLFGTSNMLDIGVENTKGWQIFGSLSYTTQNSVYRNVETEIETTTVVGTGQHIDVNGFTQNQQVDLQQTTTTQNNINWNRRHKYINVGIGVGKELARYGAFGVGINTAINYNVSSKHSGYYFDELQSGIVKFSSQDQNNYKQSTGFSGRLGMTIEWRYNAIGLGVSPFLQYRINSILNESNFYNIKDNHIGLNFSISYRPK